jgi:hypothetical protein
MHMAEALRYAPVAHDDGDLVKGLRKKRPEVPVVLGATQASSRVALDCMVEIRKAQRVPEEKYGCVVADEIPVALICVELQSEATNIALRIGCASFAGHGGEADEHRRLLSHFGKYTGFRETRYIVSHRKRSECASAFGVHSPFWNDLAVEMCNLVD